MWSRVVWVSSAFDANLGHDVINGAQDLGVELDEHIQFVVDAMRASADALGLGGSPGTASP